MLIWIKWNKDFWGQFWKEFYDFYEKFTCLTLFADFTFLIFVISTQIRLSTQSEQAPTQKLLFLNESPGRLIGHLQ